MGNEERRKNPRVQIFDPITFLSSDSNGETLEQNIAVVRNVSKTGIQIETFRAIYSKNISLMFFDLSQNQIEATGEVVYCRKNDSGQYHIGINFVGKAKENLHFVKALVKSYHYQKERSRLIISPGIQN
jgi:PilZ domain